MRQMFLPTYQKDSFTSRNLPRKPMDSITEVLSRYGEVIKRQYVDDIKSKPATKYGAVNASGKLANSVRFEADETGLRLYALGYAYYVENGRGAGKAPPRAAIEQWITDKGLVSDISTKSLAYLIQRKIAREGTEAKKQGGTSLLGDIITPELINSIKNDIFLLLKAVTVQGMRQAFEPLKQAA